MPLANFKLYEFAQPVSDCILDKKSAWEYCEVVNLNICNQLNDAFDKFSNVYLNEYDEWHDERSTHSVRMPHEFPGWQPSVERYEWRASRLQGRDDVPHTIVSSYHVTHSPASILRGELLTILRVMWWKTRVVIGKGHEITPILLIPVRPHNFRVIEAYYNGSKFVLRYSKPVPLNIAEPLEQQQEAYNWVYRWIFGSPVRDTQNFGPLYSSSLLADPQSPSKQEPATSSPSLKRC
ncbi:hypothetical protein AJ78_05292 [Emergomyces pasteurianus Ep9510]|uniref:Uncharacterized protein n=1 Tax=Emergomyces pasteurianus Ep9510 TaxID=1447872 RepID=A0A1J9QGP2_9EURO|nr:hypothetical protein AJ78_05292 [Emergomyces pasteurianus Ep9510]